LRMANIDAAGSSEKHDFSAIDLVAVTQNVTADFVPRAAEAGIDLGFEGEGEATILAEPLLIGELIGNLVSNAINYAGRGAEVTVRVG
ncbi:sensor histidine kinase, partial [Staphylococcus aureus]